jgi:phosphonate transport system substrate-binding protein
MASPELLSKRRAFRFGLPPSLGLPAASDRARRLEGFFGSALGKRVEVSVAPSYEALTKELLNGKVDAAWAPPFVCARIEAMGVKVLVRGIRRGQSSYRAALLCRADSKITLDQLNGVSAVWTDPDAVAGYLLPMALLRSKGMDPARIFAKQSFAGSYQAAVTELLEGKAEVTSIFAPPSGAGAPGETGMEQIAPERKHEVSVVAFTDEAPNDGVAVAVTTSLTMTTALEKTLLALHQTPEGGRLLQETFHAEKFEPAPRMGYRALYRVALASL